MTSGVMPGDETFYSISIFMEQAIGNLYYRAYTASNGWTNWAMNGQQSGIPADMAPIEAIQVRFDGPVLDEYDLFYSAVLKDGTATGWAKNGMTAGSMNQGNPIKAFRMAFFRKADPSDITVGDAVVSAHPDGIQYIDERSAISMEGTAPTLPDGAGRKASAITLWIPCL